MSPQEMKESYLCVVVVVVVVVVGESVKIIRVDIWLFRNGKNRRWRSL